MALWEGFLECWNDCVGRMDLQVCLLDYLKIHDQCIRPETTKHLLSIGPGCGEIDHELVSRLPHLMRYTALDPDVGALATVKARLEEFTAIERNYVNGVMQTYTGPPDGADIILMSQVAYYFADSFTKQMGRALSWLKPGGRILLVHNQAIKLLVSEFNVHSDTFDLISADDIRHHLVSMRANFTESPIDFTLDVSYPGSSYYGFVSVILNWKATKQEVDKALTLLRTLFMPGTEKMYCVEWSSSEPLRQVYRVIMQPNIKPRFRFIPRQ